MRSTPQPTRHVALMIALIMAVPGQHALGQATGVIKGRITDSTSHRSLQDAQIGVIGTGSGALSSTNGEFTINAVPAGARVVRIRRVGFAQVDRTVNVAPGADREDTCRGNC